MSENLNDTIEIENDDLKEKHINDSRISLNSFGSRGDLSSILKASNSNDQLNFYSTSTPIMNKGEKMSENNHDSGIVNNSSNNSNPLNEKVASLASSVYTELEKIVKLHGRDTVKDLMSILVNILEALDGSYQEKEEQIVENELLKDDYEKLLLQYEREKQARKDNELKLFQSEDSFAEQKRDYEEKVVSLESIVRMIDLKSKNTTDHVQRLEEKENEMKREYTKLHERYSELFKTHCDYMDRTKILFGNENRSENNQNPTQAQSNTINSRIKLNKQMKSNTTNTNTNSNQIFEMLSSEKVNVNRNDLINAIKSSSRTDINLAINSLLSEELNKSDFSSGKGDSLETVSENSSSLTVNGEGGSMTSLTSENNKGQFDRQSSQELSKNDPGLEGADEGGHDIPNRNSSGDLHNSYNGLQSAENFDDRLLRVEFDDTASEYSNMASMTQKEYEEEEELANRSKNDLSLFNELSRENYDITELDDGADLTGMSREVANLIRENSELLQTKHALNVLKDDLIVRLDNFSSEMVLLREELKNLQTIKACLQLRISELEEEAKKTKEEAAEKVKKQEEEDESVPLSQRKRFTRAEMARVLMERNQYKERLMDLQEAVRWTEMMRASKIDSSGMPNAMAKVPNENSLANSGNNIVNSNNSENSHQNNNAEQGQEQKKKTPMWKFFSDLFGSSSSSSTSQNQAPVSPVHGSSSQVSSNSNSSSGANSQQLSPSAKKLSLKNKQQNSTDENSSDSMTVNLSDKAAKAYEFLKDESKNKSVQIRQSENKTSLIVKEEGRMQAYGWSLPSKSSLGGNSSDENISKNSQKSSSAPAITVPVPVYCRPLFEHDNHLKMSCASTVNYIFDKNCVENCSELIEASKFSYFKSNTGFKSSCIWICNLNEKDTHVSILDANKPGDLIEQFILKYLKIHCMKSISGAKQSEFPLSEEKLEILAQNVAETNRALDLAKHADNDNELLPENKNKEKGTENITFIEESDQDLISSTINHPLTANKIGEGDSDATTPASGNDQEKLLSSLYPTMWLGSQEGWLLVHSTVSNISKTIDKVKLKDAVLSIIQNGGRVIVGVADGSIAIFHRNSDGLWDLKNFYLINVDKPSHSIRCLINVNANVWCGCRNKIFILNPDEFKLLSTIEVHPRKENQVRHMAWINDGVWVSLRLDSTLRLYHAKTQQHLQYLDIEPFITRMLGSSNLGHSLVRISSLLIGANRLWIGTGNGVILSLPFNESVKNATNSTNLSNIPGTGVRVTADQDTNLKDSHIPYCNLCESQFSFHGHRNAIKFFLNVPIEAIVKLKSTNNNMLKSKEESYEKVETMLVLSGGHGYIDFRIGDNGKSSLEKSNEKRYGEIKNEALDNKTPNTASNKHERSHLIVWQLNNSN